MKRLLISLTAALFFVGGSISHAQNIAIQGVGTFASDDDDLNEAEQKQLIDAALSNALERHVSTLPPAQQQIYQEKKTELTADLGRYFPSHTIIESTYDRGSDLHTMVVRGELNSNQLNFQFTNGTGNQTASAPVAISFLFVSRRAESAQIFQDRVVSMERVQDQNSLNANTEENRTLAADQSERVTASSASIEEDASETSSTTINESSDGTVVTTTGGSTLQQANRYTYTVSSPENVNATFLDVFTSSGFEVYDYRDVSLECSGISTEDIYQEFSSSDELTAETRRSVFDAARICGLNAFAIGTLDAGIDQVDPVTGNRRVFVNVRAQVYSLAGRLPRPIASFGPVQYSGLGADPLVAESNGLISSAREVANSIAAQLRANGL
jgi:hypothetical protein